MTAFVVGFALDVNSRRVVLIRKNRPEWQAGYLNGVGGRIERGETPRQAMDREFQEEALLSLDWPKEPYAILDGLWGAVSFFRAFLPLDNMSPDVLTRTDEKIEIWSYADSDLYRQTVPNLSWLIPLALYTHDIYEPVVAREMER